MMPEEWPLAVSSADENAPARSSGGDRLATVRADFFLDPRQRLSEQERALMTAMLHCLVGDVADEIRARLPKGMAPANDDTNAGLVDRLGAAGLLDQPGLVSLLLRRADEERIAASARVRSGRREARVLQGLVSHQDGAVAGAAMALILGRGKRRDRFGQCLVALDDFGSFASTFVHVISAGVARELRADRGAESVDIAVTKAACELLAEVDTGRSMDALTASLVQLLDEQGSLSDELILAAGAEGEVQFVAHALSRLGGIPASTSLDELLFANAGRIMLFLRASGARRQLAAGLLASIGDLLGISDPGAAIDRFDQITDESAVAARARLASALAYRDALDALDRSDGHGAL